jgi:hypothetical protein
VAFLLLLAFSKNHFEQHANCRNYISSGNWQAARVLIWQSGMPLEIYNFYFVTDIDQPLLEISSGVISAIGLLLKMMKEFVCSHFVPVRCC